MTGAAFAGHAVKRRGGVLFIAVEGREEIPIRLEALNRVKCGKAERLPFFCLDDIPRLLERGAADKIAADANAVAAEMQQRFGLPLALIIVDTVAAGAGYAKSGDENDAAIAQRIMDTLARISKLTGAFVLAVDHFGKVVETGTRGSSAKESFADVVLALLGEKELGGGVKNPRMAARKRRGGANGEEFAFTAQLVAMGTDEDGDPIDTLVLEWGGEIEPPSSSGRVAEITAAPPPHHDDPAREPRHRNPSRRFHSPRTRPRDHPGGILQLARRRRRHRGEKTGGAEQSLSPGGQRRAGTGSDRRQSGRWRDFHLV